MTWTTVAIRLTIWKSFHFNEVYALARLQIADLKTQQIVDIDEHQRLGPVDRERADGGAERSDRAFDRVVISASNRQQRRTNPRQINVLTVRTVNGIVRP